MNRLIAVAVLAGVFLAAGCVTTGEIEGHKIRPGTENVRQEPVPVYNQALADAPSWFKEYWAEYLGEVRGSYAVMAVDRRLRAAHYIYCPGPCPDLIGAQHQSWKAVNYKHAALKACRKAVREDFPAEKPACATFAISDKIVWKGPLPWE